MSTFSVLTGAAIGKAIASFGKTIATFKAREHQLAFSALNHVDLHNDAKYLNALHDATPANYRAGLVRWACDLGRVNFDVKAGAFVYAKNKKSDLETAMKVAPADYQKAKGEQAEKAFDLEKTLEKLIEKAAEKGTAMRDLNALKLCLSTIKGAEIVPVQKPAVVVKKARPTKVAEAAEVAQAA